jgi:hypothetical protein
MTALVTFADAFGLHTGTVVRVTASAVVLTYAGSATTTALRRADVEVVDVQVTDEQEAAA